MRRYNIVFLFVSSNSLLRSQPRRQFGSLFPRQSASVDMIGSNDDAAIAHRLNLFVPENLL
jgi:hypothetical protein